MILDWTKFQQKYSQASDSIKFLIDSEAFPTCASEICLNNDIDTSKKRNVVLVFLNRALNLETEENILTLLQQDFNVTKEKSREIIEQIDNCIIEHTTNTLETRDILCDISEAEAALETISPIRTMSGDSIVVTPKEETYTSMQSAILNEGK
jgi:DNA-directed RNA polymerase beta subunit